MQKFFLTGRSKRAEVLADHRHLKRLFKTYENAFLSPTKSLQQAESQLQVAKIIVHRLLRKGFKLLAYKVQIV